MNILTQVVGISFYWANNVFAKYCHDKNSGAHGQNHTSSSFCYNHVDDPYNLQADHIKPGGEHRCCSKLLVLIFVQVQILTLIRAIKIP